MADSTQPDEQTEEQKAAQDFVAAGQARVAPILDGMNSLADRVGGVGGLQMHAMHGILVAYTSALLNHIAGIAPPEAEEPYTHDNTGERVTLNTDPAPLAPGPVGGTLAQDINPVQVGQPINEPQVDPLAPLASTGSGESPAPEADLV
jgi:hypothetical protein